MNNQIDNQEYGSSYLKRMMAGDGHHSDLTLKETTESFVKFGFVEDLYVRRKKEKKMKLSRPICAESVMCWFTTQKRQSMMATS